MRTFLMISLITIMAVGSLLAAVPTTMNYQGRLTDASGDPVADGGYLVKFIIYDAATAGTDLWNSGFQAVITVNGFFSYELGSMITLPDNLFTDTSRYLGITVGVDPEMSPRTRFETSSYAYQSLRADSAGHADHAATSDLLGSLTPGNVALSSHDHAGTYSETSHAHDADITAVNAGTGLTGGGTSGSVTVNADDNYLQRRVSGTAPAGSAITGINQDGSVTTSEIGGSLSAVGIVDVSGSTTSASWETVDSIYFTAPATGYVLISVAGVWRYDADATTSSSLTVEGAMCLSSTKNNGSASNGAYQNIFYCDPDNASAINATGTINFQRIDWVPAGFNSKYYFNISADGTHSLGTWWNTRVSVIFVPNLLPVSSD